MLSAGVEVDVDDWLADLNTALDEPLPEATADDIETRELKRVLGLRGSR